MNDIYDLYIKNELGRDFVVGDLHGCYELLMKALNEVSFNKKMDRLFAVGDLIDRGPNSDKTLMLLEQPWFHSVLGNHEDMMIKSINPSTGELVSHYEAALWYRNGGEWFDYTKADKKKLYNIVKSLPYSIEVQTNQGVVGITHADFFKSNVWHDVIESDNYNFELEILIWSRITIGKFLDYGIEEEVNGVHAIIHGHTPVNNPLKVANRYFIDTGAVFKGSLTLMQIQPEINLIEIEV